MKKIIHTPNAPAPIGPYSQAVLKGNMLFTSGQIAINPRTGSLVMAAPWAISDVPKPASFEKRARRTPAIMTDPTAPPITASPVNASCNINPNNDGISAK